MNTEAVSPGAGSGGGGDSDMQIDDDFAVQLAKIVNGEMSGTAQGWKARPFDHGEIEIETADGRCFHVIVEHINEDI